MSQLNGKKLKLTVFGQSHSKAIGAVIEGLPAGIKLDTDAIQAFLDRRRPGKNKLFGRGAQFTGTFRHFRRHKAVCRAVDKQNGGF